MIKRIQKWKAVQLYMRFSALFIKYEISQTAASIAYYFTLAVFPFLMFLAALVGVLAFPADALEKAIAPLLSRAVAEIILEYYTYLTSVSGVFSLVFGLVFSLYSASRAIRALTYGINKVYHTHKARSFFADLFRSVMFTLGVSAVLFLALFMVSIGSNLPKVLNLSQHIRIPLISNAGYIYLVAVGAAFFILTLVYMYAPVRRVPLCLALPGSVLCLFGLHAISFGVGVYVCFSTRFSMLYGSIGAIIIMLLWLYLFGICVMLGAILNRYAEKRKRARKRK